MFVCTYLKLCLTKLLSKNIFEFVTSVNMYSQLYGIFFKINGTLYSKFRLLEPLVYNVHTA